MKNMRVQADIGLKDALTFGFELGVAFAIGYAVGTYGAEVAKDYISEKRSDKVSTISGRSVSDDSE